MVAVFAARNSALTCGDAVVSERSLAAAHVHGSRLMGFGLPLAS
jgi:hypothetical protein